VLLSPGAGITHLRHVVLPGESGGKPRGIEGDLQLGHIGVSSVRVSTTASFVHEERPLVAPPLSPALPAVRGPRLAPAARGLRPRKRLRGKGDKFPAMLKTADQLRRLTSA